MIPMTNQPEYYGLPPDIFFDCHKHYKLPQSGSPESPKGVFPVAIMGDVAKMTEHANRHATPFVGIWKYTSGCRIKTMWEDSPLHKAGVRINDRITKVDGVNIPNAEVLIEQLNLLHVGETYDLTAMKPDGSKMRVKVTPMATKRLYEGCTIFYDKRVHKTIPHTEG